jgi:antitoxin VapB
VAVHRSRTFRSGNSEAIRLPKDIAFGDDVEVIIVRSGDVLTIYRAPATVAEMIERLRTMPAVPEIERRDADELAERPGL